eukprot:292480-Pelagomonas_calceolata.AAC.8
MHGFLGYSRLAAAKKLTYLEIQRLTHGIAQQAPLLSHKLKGCGFTAALLNTILTGVQNEYVSVQYSELAKAMKGCLAHRRCIHPANEGPVATAKAMQLICFGVVALFSGHCPASTFLLQFRLSPGEA